MPILIPVQPILIILFVLFVRWLLTKMLLSNRAKQTVGHIEDKKSNASRQKWIGCHKKKHKIGLPKSALRSKNKLTVHRFNYLVLILNELTCDVPQIAYSNLLKL